MALIGKKTNTREIEDGRDELARILSAGKAMDPSGGAASEGHERRRINMFLLGNMLEFRSELRSVENESVDTIMWSHGARMATRMSRDDWHQIALWGTNFVGDRRKIIDIAETVMVDNMECLRGVIEANRHVPAGGSDQEEARHRKMALMEIDETVKKTRKSAASARAVADTFKRGVESIDVLRLNANDPWKSNKVSATTDAVTPSFVLTTGHVTMKYLKAMLRWAAGIFSRGGKAANAMHTAVVVVESAPQRIRAALVWTRRTLHSLRVFLGRLADGLDAALIEGIRIVDAFIRTRSTPHDVGGDKVLPLFS